MIVSRTGSNDAWCQEARLTKTCRTLELLSKRLLRRNLGLVHKVEVPIEVPDQAAVALFLFPHSFLHSNRWQRTTFIVGWHTSQAAK